MKKRGKKRGYHILPSNPAWEKRERGRKRERSWDAACRDGGGKKGGMEKGILFRSLILRMPVGGGGGRRKKKGEGR